MAEKITSKILSDIETILRLSIDEKINLQLASSQNGMSKNFMDGIIPKIHEAIKNKHITKAQSEKVLNLYSKYMGLLKSKQISSNTKQSTKTTSERGSDKQKKAQRDYTAEEEEELLEYDATTDQNYDDRSVGEVIRGNETFFDSSGRETNRITGYKYKIYIRGEKALIGSFTLDEMNRVYKLYTFEGAGLTIRSVSREFGFLTFRDFKRILRAFNITKASIPIAPHILEESTEDELRDLIFQNKENNLFKKIDNERSRHYEKEYVKTKKEIFEIQSDVEWVEKIVSAYFKKRKPELPKPISRPLVTLNRTDKPLFCIFGDIHYGKKFDRTVFGREYNKDIAHDRVMQIAERTINEAKLLKPKEIVMISLGDLLECAMEDGMHGTVALEMDLFQEEQIFFAADSLVMMLKKIISESGCKITFCSIHGNHDRIGLKRDDDKNRTAGKVVTGMIKRLLANEKNFTVEMPENNLLRLKRGKICVFAHHGDSSLNKKKPSEIVNIWGEGTSCYHLILKGHWHSLKADEGTNYLTLTTPSVASADKFILEELGNNNLPGFVLGHEPDCYGFDYKKITLH